MKMLMAVVFLLMMQGPAAAQRDKMQLGEKLDMKVARSSKKDTKVIDLKAKAAPLVEKLDTKVERQKKTK